MTTTIKSLAEQERWLTFESVRYDGASDLFERVCNNRQAKLQAARMLRGDQALQMVVVFEGRKDEVNPPIFCKKRRMT